MASHPTAFGNLPEQDVAPSRDLYHDFQRAKNHIFSEYALLDGVRFFDVIAQSNAKYWQSIGEQNPIRAALTVPNGVIARVTLERIRKEPSIVKFIELLDALVKHVGYASNVLTIHSDEDVNDAMLSDAIIGEVMEAFDKFNLTSLVRLDRKKNLHSGLVEDESIVRASKDLLGDYHSDVLDQYKEDFSSTKSGRSSENFIKTILNWSIVKKITGFISVIASGLIIAYLAFRWGWN